MSIKVVGLHPWMKNVEDIVEQLHITNPIIINELEYNESSPDLVIASEHIYRNKKQFLRLKEYYKEKKAILVFYGAEALYPDLNIFDYVISFSREYCDYARIARIPTCIFYDFIKDGVVECNGLNANDAQTLLKTKEGFCNFIYSNAHAHPMRDSIFWGISKYKKVDSLGGHLNNTGRKSTRKEKNWSELSVDEKKKYKFSIASENACFEGYTSEKILTTFKAHSIPIYWGNPRIVEDFNEKAFINCNNYSCIDEVVETVKKIDGDDSLWAEIISEPWQTESQVEKMYNEIKYYDDFLNLVFKSANDHNIQRPIGTFADYYAEWFFRRFNPKRSVIKMIKKLFS